MLKPAPLDTFDPRVLICPLHNRTLVALAVNPLCERKLLCYQCMKLREVECEDVMQVLTTKGIDRIVKSSEQAVLNQNTSSPGGGIDYTTVHIESIFDVAINNLKYYKDLLLSKVKTTVASVSGVPSTSEIQSIKKRMLKLLQQIADTKDINELQASEYMGLYGRLDDMGKRTGMVLQDLNKRLFEISIKIENLLKTTDQGIKKILDLHGFSESVTDSRDSSLSKSPDKSKLPQFKLKPHKEAVSLVEAENYHYDVDKIRFLENIPGTDQLLFCTDHDLHLVDTKTFEVINSFEKAHSNEITGMRYFPKRGTLFTSSADYKLRSWKIDRAISPRQTFELPGPISSFDVIDKTKVVVGGEFPALYVIDAPSKDKVCYSIAPYCTVLAVRYLPWRDSAVFSAEKGALAIYDFKAKVIVCHLKGYAMHQSVNLLELDVKRRLLYSANTDRPTKLCIWDVNKFPEEYVDHFELKNYYIGQIIYTIGPHTIAMSVKKYPLETSQAMILLINKKLGAQEGANSELLIQELALEELPMEMMPLAHIFERDLLVAGCNRTWDGNIAIRTVRIESEADVVF